MYRNVIFIIFLAGIFSGCSIVADLGNTVKGSYYLKTGDYRQAEIDFKEAIIKHPDSAIAQYYMGRFLSPRIKRPRLCHISKKQSFLILEMRTTTSGWGLHMANWEILIQKK